MQKFSQTNVVLSQDSSCDHFRPKQDFKELLESLLWLQKNRLSPVDSRESTQKIEPSFEGHSQPSNLPSFKELCNSLANPFKLEAKSSMPPKIQVPLPLRTRTTPMKPFFGLT